MTVGWGVPMIFVGGLLIFDRENIIPKIKRNPNFQYGNAQAAICLFVLVISFVGKNYQKKKYFSKIKGIFNSKNRYKNKVQF